METADAVGSEKNTFETDKDQKEKEVVKKRKKNIGLWKYVVSCY